MSTSQTDPSKEHTEHKHLVVDPFCYRQFSERTESQAYVGTVFDMSIEQFERIVNERFQEELLQDGYAPFCRHLFVQNDFTNAKVNVLPITPENEHLLRTRYEARNDKELPVLSRWFPQELIQTWQESSSPGTPPPSLMLPTAKYLDLILYSREQIQLENAAQGKSSSSSSSDKDPKESSTQPTAPWGIVSIKAQDVDFELPMNPITVMRNSLGKEEGGSGVPLDRNKYMESVNYWKNHAVVS